MMNNETIVEAIDQARLQARCIILKYFNQLEAYEHKDDHSPVTIADREAEDAIRNVLQQAFPDFSIVGEEFENTITDNPLCWVIDPIDGTKSFIAGAPVFGSLICLAKNGNPLLGSQDHPALDMHWIGGSDHPTCLNNKPVHVSKCLDIKDAILCSTAPEMLLENSQNKAFNKIASKVRFVRYGLDCFHYGLLASGKIDLVVEASLQPYDYMAPAAIVLGAGGVACDWQGNPANIASGNEIIAASSQHLLEQALEVMHSK